MAVPHGRYAARDRGGSGPQILGSRADSRGGPQGSMGVLPRAALPERASGSGRLAYSAGSLERLRSRWLFRSRSGDLPPDCIPSREDSSFGPSLEDYFDRGDIQRRRTGAGFRRPSGPRGRKGYARVPAAAAPLLAIGEGLRPHSPGLQPRVSERRPMEGDSARNGGFLGAAALHRRPAHFHTRGP